MLFGGIFMERKVKYNLTFKLKCVKEALENYTSVNSISSREGFSESLLREWLSDYQSKGIYGLIPKHKNNTYSQSFKYNVLKSIERENLSLADACLKFNIPSKSVIIKWQKDFATFGLNALQAKSKGRPKNMNTPKRKSIKNKQPLTKEEELLLENERLRSENAFLKKYNALVQADEENLKKQQRKPLKN